MLRMGVADIFSAACIEEEITNFTQFRSSSP